MSKGWFDKTAVPLGWFDETAQAKGWFDPLLLDVASSGAQTLTQSTRFDNANSFYAFTVTPGAVTLTQSARFNNTNSFFAFVVTPGAVNLVQSARFNNVNTFFAFTVSLASGTQSIVQIARFNNVNTFYSLIVNDETIWRNLMNYSTIVDLALGYVDRRNDPEAVSVMDSMLRLVESKINRFLQSSKGGSIIYVEILDEDQEYYDLPNLFSSYRSIFISTTQDSSAVKTVLEYATPYKLANVSSGHYYSIINDKLKIYSDAIAVGSYIEMVSYLSITPLTSVDPNNWLSDMYPDCYVHGLMAQLYAFAKDWPAAERMEAKFTQTLDEIEIQDDKTTWSGTPLTMSIG